MKRLLAIILIAVCAVATGATAQNDPGMLATPACPTTAQELPLEALYGTWGVRFDDPPGDSMEVRLAKHPDYAGVKGTITRGATAAQLAGDVDDQGQLTLDESQDGRRISGIWLGTQVPGTCGREFRGTWRNVADDSMHPFVLNKTGPVP